MVFRPHAQPSTKKTLYIIGRYALSFMISAAPFFLLMPTTPITNEIFFLLWALTIFIIVISCGSKPGVAASIFSGGLYYGLFIATNPLLYASIMAGFGCVMAWLYELHDQQVRDVFSREEYFRTLADRSIHPIVLKDEQGSVQYASNSIVNVLKYRSSELVGKRIDAYIHPDDQATHKKFYQTVVKRPGEQMFIEIRMVQKDGTVRWLRNDTMNMLHDEETSAIIASFQDITEQKKHDEERLEIIKSEKSARNVAERAVRARDEFLSIASHELKTPLTTILLQLQATLRRIMTQSLVRFSGEKLAKSLTIAEQQSHRLETLIKDLLNISLISTGRIEMNKEPTDIVLLVGDLVERMQEQAKKAGCTLRVTGLTSLRANCDPVRIEQCVVNLVTNACKYGQGKPITLTISENDTYAIVAVSDQGNGISADQHETIFEPFKRGEHTDGIKGLGVGLFIARQIARAHGGDIMLESIPGTGSTFTVSMVK